MIFRRLSEISRFLAKAGFTSGRFALRFLMMLFCSSALSAISLPTDRKALLAEGERMLYQGGADYEASLAQLKSPFALKVVHDTEAVQGIKAGDTDPEILKHVAENLHPTGTIVKGDKRLLLFDENSLEEGDVIKIDLQGKIYRVKIEKVKRNAYTLRLNSSTYTQPLVEIDSKNVKFDE